MHFGHPFTHQLLFENQKLQTFEKGFKMQVFKKENVNLWT